MERSTPQLLLLGESVKSSNFTLKATEEGEELSDWLSVEIMSKSMTHLMNLPAIQGNKQNLKRNERLLSPSGNLSKGLRSPIRRFSPGVQFSKSRDKLNVKFQHFQSSSEFIEQYRNAKLACLEEAYNKLIEREEKQFKTLDSCCSGKVTENRTENVRSSEQCSSSGSETRMTEAVQSDDLLKPSLPRTGYFTGKKWAYPKKETSNHLNYGGKRHTGTRFRGKKREVQVLNTGNICLKGTGKPINASLNQTWTVPLSRRSACKSAPTASQKSWRNVLSPRLKSNPVNCTPTDVVSKSQNFVDFTTLSSRATKDKQYVPKAKTFDSFEHLRKVGEMSEQAVNNQKRLDYENMFKEVIDFYGNRKQDRSEIIRIGT